MQRVITAVHSASNETLRMRHDVRPDAIELRRSTMQQLAGVLAQMPRRPGDMRKPFTHADAVALQALAFLAQRDLDGRMADDVIPIAAEICD